MEWLAADGYWLSRLVFQRALAVVYLVAFLNAANQFRALLGRYGLLPIPAYLARPVPAIAQPVPCPLQ